MNTIDDYQRQLLQEARFVFQDAPLTEAAESAFKSAPRHLFINRYRKFATKEWQDVTAENLELHLGRLYADDALCLFGDDDNDPIASISQPSFVLRCLDMLQLRPGQRVFELGTGSGWNAGLIAKSVGPDGHVYSVELIPELGEEAKTNLNRAGISNVTVITGDGGDGYAAAAPYDRATFTAGTFDLPRHFYAQVKDGGLLLVGIKSEGGGDTLFLLRRHDDHFESLDSLPCAWVQMRGKYQLHGANPQPVESLPGWAELQDRKVGITRFWWESKARTFLCGQPLVYALFWKLPNLLSARLSIGYLTVREKSGILDCGISSKDLSSLPNTIALFHTATPKRRNV
jgi:protein-L-isoaspartate(D-aspartate) O-methyltransferase